MNVEDNTAIDECEENERPVAAISTGERLTKLILRAKEAQDTCGWADPTVKDGQMQLASGAVELGRIMVETLMILRSELGEK